MTLPVRGSVVCGYWLPVPVCMDYDGCPAWSRPGQSCQSQLYATLRTMSPRAGKEHREAGWVRLSRDVYMATNELGIRSTQLVMQRRFKTWKGWRFANLRRFFNIRALVVFFFSFKQSQTIPNILWKSKQNNVVLGRAQGTGCSLYVLKLRGIPCTHAHLNKINVHIK